MTAEPFVPPPYPYDRLDRLAPLATHHDGGVVDLSIGTPFDPPPASVINAFGRRGPSAVPGINWFGATS